MYLELRNVNDKIIKRAALTYLILIRHSERQNKMAHIQTFQFNFLNTMLTVVWGLGKIKHKKEKVTEGWKVLHKD